MTPKKDICKQFREYVEEHDQQNKAYLTMPTYEGYQLLDHIDTQHTEIERLRQRLGIHGGNRHSVEEAT